MQVKATISTGQIAAMVEKKRRQIEAARTNELTKIGQEEVAITQQRIRDSKTDPNGRVWQPWSMATMRQRQREGNAGRGLLYRTGALLNSIQFKVEDGVLTVFTDDTKARRLQFGTTKMPARPFLGWGSRINTIVKRLTDIFK